MLSTTRIAATRFEDSGKIYMRVVYQNKAKDIVETSFDSYKGWHTGSDQIVVSGNNVMEGSPLAITSWNAGREVRNRFMIYYANLCLYTFRHESTI
jgi:Fungal fucose-specific lectin